jgi:3-oxoacyl-[acyl-carrier protein] reductase
MAPESTTKPSEQSQARRILITGTSRGIGRSVAEHFLQRGDKVIGCARSETPFQHPNYEHHIADLSLPSEVADMMSAIRRRQRHLDVLINNAAVASMGPAALQPPSAARKMVELNFCSPIHVTHDAIRLLRSGICPRIINLTSVAVPFRVEGEAVYSATKAAIEQWTRVLAKEIGPLGITVNAIGPTPVDTDLLRGVPREKLDALVDRQSIPRWATIADIVHTIEFFLHPNSDMITGQVLYLGGAG